MSFSHKKEKGIDARKTVCAIIAIIYWSSLYMVYFLNISKYPDEVGPFITILQMRTEAQTDEVEETSQKWNQKMIS